MLNFIRTKTEPTIFYLPAKHTRDTEQMLKETRAAIKQKIASLKLQLQPMNSEWAVESATGEDAMGAAAAAATVAVSECSTSAAHVAKLPAEGSHKATGDDEDA